MWLLLRSNLLEDCRVGVVTLSWVPQNVRYQKSEKQSSEAKAIVYVASGLGESTPTNTSKMRMTMVGHAQSVHLHLLALQSQQGTMNMKGVAMKELVEAGTVAGIEIVGALAPAQH